MQEYGNSSHDSGVAAHEIGEDSITVRFRSGGTYLYTYASTGEDRIEQMKALAKAGEGLSSYISQVVKLDFEERLD